MKGIITTVPGDATTCLTNASGSCLQFDANKQFCQMGSTVIPCPALKFDKSAKTLSGPSNTYHVLPDSGKYTCKTWMDRVLYFGWCD